MRRGSTSYDDFIDVLGRFRSLSSGALIGGGVVPFAAYAAGIEPPWPPGGMMLTALIQILVLVLTFQLFRHAEQKKINSVLVVGAIVFGASGFLYILMFSFFTYSIPITGQIFVKGFICRGGIPESYKAECPFLGIDKLNEAAYNAEWLWTNWSIYLTQITLFFSWGFAMAALSTVIGTFIVYQTKIPTTRT